MITALVQFRLPHPLSRKEAGEIFSTTAPKYKNIKGLIRKYYILSEDGATGGGVYIWNSRRMPRPCIQRHGGSSSLTNTERSRRSPILKPPSWSTMSAERSPLTDKHKLPAARPLPEAEGGRALKDR